jgi:pSer/pThr/pTyr-binding forkhead associated (FHA) protein
LSELEDILKTAAREAGLSFAAPPTITVAPDDSLGPGEVRVIASQEVLRSGETQAKAAAEPAEEPGNIPENAFLIVEGVKVFPLTRAVINVGRRLDNHLVIEDPRISRNHVQLRAIKGRYVIFDLNSTGGTYVNGQRVTQSVLYAGDVISLAGVPLIFGQDNPPPRPDLANTSPLSPSSSDRPTAILSRPDEPPK